MLCMEIGAATHWGARKVFERTGFACQVCQFLPLTRHERRQSRTENPNLLNERHGTRVCIEVAMTGAVVKIGQTSLEILQVLDVEYFGLRITVPKFIRSGYRKAHSGMSSIMYFHVLITIDLCMPGFHICQMLFKDERMLLHLVFAV
jgi:hypothetical protein